MAHDLNILLVDDEINMLEALKDVLENEGYRVIPTNSGHEALRKLEEIGFVDLVITDLKMPKMNGIELMQRIRERFSHIQVVILTAYGTIESAVDAIKMGAYDYIVKPFKTEDILRIIARFVERKSLLEDNVYFQKELSKAYGFENILGNSTAMQEVFKKIEIVAETDSSVILTGESGTGKELLAHVLHYTSRRKSKRFVKASCASFAEGVLESELFGHERGAFTSAVSRKPGRFEVADGGTLFLDEIGDLPLSTQVKLLRVLQMKEFERVGGTETLKVNVRMISATNQDLELKIKEGTFREDLYYRLNVVPIHVPALRERKEDIPILAEYFLKMFSEDTNKKVDTISEEAIELMLAYSWPGNVRELRNYIERAVVFCQTSMLKSQDLPRIVRDRGDEKGITLHSESKSLYEMEKKLIQSVLEETKWNLSRAAGELRISRGTLYGKMKKYGLVKNIES